MTDKRNLKIAIIGAGASGIMAAIKFREAGFDDLAIFEKASDLGGTWRDNRYPGITCDVPSHAYQYSFATNPNWTRMCSPGAEILAYFRGVARDHGVDSLIRYDSEITEASFDHHQWHLTSTQGDEGLFDVVVTATGVLHHPVYPDIPGRDDFEGDCFHSARWDDSVSLRGKRVGIIGTGSTAIQIVSEVIDDVASLVLFQRTAQWIWPLPNRLITDEEKELYRSDATARQAEYKRLTHRMNSNFAAAIVGENPDGYAELEQDCIDNLNTVRDPELRAKLTPDYKVGCKRLIMSNEFYEAIQKPNAALETGKIARFVPDGIELEDGTVQALDVIVLATGFNTHQFFRPMKVMGPGGRTIEEAWRQRNEGYMTVAVPGFPNWFMIGGPTSPIGNFSWLLTAETQFAYVLKLIERLQQPGVSEIVPTAAATAAFNQAVRDRIPQTIWATGCSSWYIDASGNIASWPWTFDKFEQDLKEPDWHAFETA